MRAAQAVEYLKSLPPDEPVFVLRAQDETADKAVDGWADQAEQQDVRSGKLVGARDCAHAMRAWPTRKKPD